MAMKHSRQSFQPQPSAPHEAEVHVARRSLKPKSVQRLQIERREICRDPKIKAPSPDIDFSEVTRVGDPSVLGDGNESDVEIYKFMIETEQSESRPTPYLFDHQTNITPRMRATVIDWIIDIHKKFKMHQETLYMAVHIMDLYLTECDIDKSCYQRLSCAALMLAAKSEERSVPLMEDFVYVAGKSFSANALQRMEASVFEHVGCHVTPILAFSFVTRTLRLLGSSEQQREYCMFILDSLLLDSDFIGVRPSYLAAGVIYTGLRISNGAFAWDEDMVRNTGYEEDAIKHLANLILRALSALSKQPYQAIKKKYSPVIQIASITEFPADFL